MNNGLEIHGEEWFMIAGLLGLKRLLGEEVKTTPSGVKISSKSLSSLPEKYFEYFLTEYDIAKRDYTMMSNNLNRAKSNLRKAKEYPNDSKTYEKYAKDYLGYIRQKGNEQAKKVAKYFEETSCYKELDIVINRMKEVKDTDQIEEMEQLIHQFYEIMKTDEINSKLTLNFAKASVIAPFYGQPSFLQASFNSRSYSDHITEFSVKYVKQAQLEIEFAELLKEKGWMEIKSFVEANKSIEPFKKYWKVAKKMNELSEFKIWLDDNVLPCMFIDSISSAVSFEEMMFAPLGVSLGNSYNFFWDFEKENPLPISFLTRLILFMIPVGAAIYNRSFQTNDGRERKQFGGLVLVNKKFEEIMKQNHFYRQQRKKDAPMNQIITTLLQESQSTAEKIYSTYLFVEFHSDVKAKKTLLDYYHMPEYIARYFQGKSESLEYMKNLDLRDEFIRSILKGNDPKQTIFKYLRNAIDNRFDAFGAYIATRERARIKLLKEGSDEIMENQDNKIGIIQKQGRVIREKLINRRDEENEENYYQASGEKKITGIAYRLLNAVKASNNKEFFDTVFRLHISTGESFSPIFMDVNKDSGLDLETIGSAFIAGLLNNYTKNEEKGEEK